MSAKRNGGGAEGQTQVRAGTPDVRVLVKVLCLAGPPVPHLENKGAEQQNHKGPSSAQEPQESGDLCSESDLSGQPCRTGHLCLVTSTPPLDVALLVGAS